MIPARQAPRPLLRVTGIAHTALALLCLARCALAAAAAAARPGEGAAAGPDGAYLALCAAIKERPETVKEWVDYHAALGVGKFYLMATDDPEAGAVAEALQAHILSGLVELYSLPRVNPRTVPLLQVTLYHACLEAARERHRWAAFWDADEFLVLLDPGGPPSLPALLSELEAYGGVGVGWRTVGPSGHAARPPSGGVLANYLSCTPWDWAVNQEIKTIANTRHALEPTTDPHSFVYADGYFAVDADGARIHGTRHAAVGEAWRRRGQLPRVALYHYATKSEEEFRGKAARGSAMGNRKGAEYFAAVRAAATEACPEALAACRRLEVAGWCGGEGAGAAAER